MLRSVFVLLAILLFWACENFPGGRSKSDALSFKKIIVEYPQTFQDTNQVDDFYGKIVQDPYRWLEDEKAESTASWVSAQRSLAENYLEKIPYRQAIKKRLETFWDYERYSDLSKKGAYHYFFRNSGLQDQSVLYRAPGFRSEEMEVVLDPNTFSEDGTASLGTYRFSKDGSLLAYQVSEGGSDWNTIYVLDLKTGKKRKDRVEWVKFSDISWYGNGFFYSRYPSSDEAGVLSEKNEFHQLYYHRIGEPQSRDELVFADRANPRRNVYAVTTSDERFLVLNVRESGSGNALYFKNLSSGAIDFIPVVESFQYDFELVDNLGGALLIKTNYGAPNGRLIKVSTSRWEENYWEELIPGSDDVLQSVHLVGDVLIANYIHNASSQILIFDRSGKRLKELKLPYDFTSVARIEGNPDGQEAFLTLTTFTRPETIYRLDLKNYNLEVFRQPRIDFDPGDYDTRQEWYESYDGTRIPVFIIQKKGLKQGIPRPALLYGYGGFNIPILPEFNLTRLALFPIVLENEGICAIANIRGGGEFGQTWHLAGTRGKKQNVFDDFQAAAEYLIANRYTSSEKLAIYGRSNGGLLVGACITQRPDLYKVALPAVGVLDMLRYQHFTIGWAWAADYGTSETESGFDDLYSYSPLHNVEAARYPATLITTADRDDRVVPAHSFKFAAELQSKQKGDAPILLRIGTSTGHGAGKPTSKRIAEGADVLSFLFYNLEEDVIYDYGE